MTVWTQTSKVFAGTSLLALMMAAPAAAQDGATKKKSGTLEEIIVTAQKREQSMQEVPIAITAFSSDTIDKLAAEDISDLSIFTPGMTAGSGTQPGFKIRGIQTSDFGVGTDPAVGVYVDGVYVARSGAAVTAFSDVERVEVLKGPQGTLFGRNTAAGAIAIHTNKPEMDTTEGFLNARYGRYNKRRVEGMLNIPLGDTLALRANLVINKRDGVANDYITGEDYGREDNDTGRIQLRWEPSNKTAVNFAFEFDATHTDEGGSPNVGLNNGQFMFAPNVGFVGQTPLGADFFAPTFGLSASDPIELLEATLAAVPLQAFYAQFAPAGYTPSDATATWDVFRDPTTPGGADHFGPITSDIGNGNENRTLQGYNLTITHDMDWATLTSISAYKSFKTNNLQDEDGTNQAAFYFDTDNIEDNNHFSQEIRLNGVKDNITWVVGASYYTENAKQTSSTHLATEALDTLAYNLGITPGIVAAGFNPLDGINACESMFLDSLGGFVSLNAMPLECLNPALAGVGSMEDLANAVFSSMDGAVWTEDMHGVGDFEAKAVFADITFAASEKLNISVGARYTEDVKQWQWINGNREISNYGSLNVPAGEPLSSTLELGLGFGTPGDGVFNVADLQNAVINNVSFAAGLTPYIPFPATYDVIFPGAADLTRKTKWTNFSPRVVVDYSVNDDLMLFGSYALGYKAGGFNSVEIDSEFENEKVWNVELGMKSEWLANTLRVNASVWRYKYNNKQFTSIQPIAGSLLPNYLTQSNDVTGKGADLEVLWIAQPGLSFFGNAAYQDIRCVENCGTYNIGGVITSRDGQPTGEPTFAAAFGADYSIFMDDNSSVAIHVDHTYTSANRTNALCLANNTCGVVTLGDVPWDTRSNKQSTNARISWVDKNEKYKVSMFVQNMFNNKYLGGGGSIAFNELGTSKSRLPLGSTWGIDVGLKF